MIAVRKVLIGLVLLAGTGAQASAPVVFRTPNFESPVRGGPDEMLFVAGSGFRADDRVVYQEIREGQEQGAHPVAVPAQSTRELGTAAVVKLADPPYALTVLLPPVLAPDAIYRLWVVNADSEWSTSFTINDPRPLWFSPAYVYASQDLAGLHRRMRIIGRNLQPAAELPGLRVRFQGRKIYTVDAVKAEDPNDTSIGFVVEAQLPRQIAPGSYSISVSRYGTVWREVSEQKLTVVPDPDTLLRFSITDPRFGACQAGDGVDDSGCLAGALAAAAAAGGGLVEIPAGTWDLFPTGPPVEAQFVLADHVRLEGAGANRSTLIRHVSVQDRPRSPLVLLEGNNSVRRLRFVDERRFTTFDASRAILQLGHRYDDPRVRAGVLPGAIRNVVIADNVFRRVGMAVIDAGIPIEQLFITRNDFGGYARGLELAGISLTRLFRIEDAVVRWNRFVPGSYLDLSVGQGVIASELGASRRVDFSSNEVDGSSTEGLQEPTDQPGFRAAFFWNMHDSGEMLLLEANRISCPGDKAGDGEAIAFDGNGGTFGYTRAAPITASSARSIRVSGELAAQPSEWEGGRDSYYIGHWIQVVAGPGMGQTRKIARYRSAADGRSSVFEISPHWDVRPVAGQSRIIVARQFWQTYVIGNEITQASPPCRKSNLSGPKGGEITLWAASADSVIDGNRQFETSGVGFTHHYSVQTASCPTCANYSAVQTALQIRGNRLHGEYDWGSDCSLSGIHGTYGASPTPEAPPTTVGFGVVVADNIIEHADGLRGGAIDIVPTWHRGPEPRRWKLIDNLIVSHNIIRDVAGAAPRSACRYGPAERTGIRIEGGGNVIGSVLYRNRCEHTGKSLTDDGEATVRYCVGHSDESCECDGTAR